MRLARHWMVSLPVLLILAGPVSGGGGGTTGAQFLRIGLGARAAGMGGANCVVADDALAIYWNPAGLIQVSRNEVAFTHVEWFQGVRYEFLGYTQPVGDSGVLGAGYYLFHTGEITKTIEDAFGLYAGEDGTFTARDQSFAVSYCRRLHETISLGVNLKAIHQDNAGKTAAGYAFDLGGIYRTPLAGLSVGCNIQNMGPDIGFISQKDPLPFNVKVGSAYRILSDAFVVALDLDIPSENDLDYHAGMEYWTKEIVALRIGYNSRVRESQLNSSGLVDRVSFGFGIKIKTLQLDAAYAPCGDLGSTYSASLLLRFGAHSKNERVERDR